MIPVPKFPQLKGLTGEDRQKAIDKILMAGMVPMSHIIIKSVPPESKVTVFNIIKDWWKNR